MTKTSYQTEFKVGAMQPDLQVETAASFNNICKDYKLDRVLVNALRDVSFSIPKGETTFVTGPSGSGKSTLLNILGLIDRPTSGELSLLGENVTGLSDAKAADFRSQHIGFIFQSFNLIPVLSLLENVEFPLLRHKLSSRQRRKRAADYLDAVGLGDLMNRSPGEISGGQRQRTAIARALATQPNLIVADEPTANLDTRTSREIIALLDCMKSEFETSIVICTHETDLITQQSCRIEIVDGQLS